MPLEFFPIKTRILLPPRDDIFSLFDKEKLNLSNGDIILIATKCLAIHQGRCVKIGTIDKSKLIESEADFMMKPGCNLTVKDGVIIPFSGIDESNGNDYYILWPKAVESLLREIHYFLCSKLSLQNLGIISVDSKIEPLRKGTVGVAQGIFGFNPVKNCEGDIDIFGRKLIMTSVNVADSLASVACYLMGEGNECCPIVVVRGAENIEFGLNFSYNSMKIQEKDDMFSEILGYS